MVMVKGSYRMASSIIIPSRGQISILRPLGVNEGIVTVVPNGVNSEIFKPLNKIECRKALNLGFTEVYFCFVGNLAPWQGLSYALPAFSAVVKSNKQEVRLVIVGEGQFRQRLRALGK